MEHLDPIKVIIPQELYRRLEKDAEIFEVYRNDSEKIVMNTFLSMLILGYFERYREEVAGQYQRMHQLLKAYIGDSDKLDHAIRKLIEDRAEAESRDLRDEKTRSLSIRPTMKTDAIISGIEDNMSETRETQSGYYRRMFYSYLRLPIYEREKIIYHETVEKLTRACDEHRMVSFTIRNRGRVIHKAIPYKLVHGLDERHNYLLCQELNQITMQPMASSFRLSRIINANVTFAEGKITDQVKGFLNSMEEYGPQYSINQEITTCVELSKAGRASFRAIYNERPICVHRDEPDENGNQKFYFRCSQNQLLLYFRRFNPGEATVLYPETLAEDLRDFHRKHLEI